MTAKQVSIEGRPSAWSREARLGVLLAMICGAVVILCLLLAWAWPRATGDTFMALALGRDVMNGKLGAPDDWSFLTGDKVWVTANWGTGLLLYLVYSFAGEVGLLGVKLAFLLGIGTSVLVLARTLAVQWPLSLLTVGAVFLGNLSYIDLRPNLVLLLLTPLLVAVLIESRCKPARIWWVPVLLLIWANTHGSFLFGLGVMGLWLAVHVIPQRWAERSLHFSPEERTQIIACLLATGLAVLVNPFGVSNLVSALQVADDPVWLEVREWHSVFDEGVQFGTVSEFFFSISSLALIGSLWALLRAVKVRREHTPWLWKDVPIHVVVFYCILVAVVTAMAFSSRRFIPLASVVCVPAIAALIQDMMPRRVPVAATIILLLGGSAVGYALPKVQTMERYYSDLKNPGVLESESLFRRMLGYQLFPSVGATDFMNENALGGRAIHEWGWEGYLHLHCPQLKLFIGGRAQTVYHAEDMRRYLAIRSGKDTVDQLASLSIGIAVLNANNNMAKLLLAAPQRRWVVLYSDDRAWVLADLSSPNSSALSLSLQQDRLAYPSAAAHARSRFAYLASPAVRTAPDRLFEAGRKSLEVSPTKFVLSTLVNLGLRDPKLRQSEVIPILGRLDAQSVAGASNLPALRWRREILKESARTYAAEGDRARVREIANELDAVRSALRTAEAPDPLFNLDLEGGGGTERRP